MAVLAESAAKTSWTPRRTPALSPSDSGDSAGGDVLPSSMMGLRVLRWPKMTGAAAARKKKMEAEGRRWCGIACARETGD